MSGETFYSVSLLAAFIAGMVALFAPCCISYLLPAYLGSVFKEKKRILFMTLVYSLGIAVVMLPVVLGAKALSSWFSQWHDQTYFIGGGLMILVGILALLGIKLPMPKWIYKQTSKTDIGSIFSLGVVSGITSSCCAPVLIGVMALSSLTPSLIQALGVGGAYVLGMVTPLYLAAAVIDSKNLLKKPIFRKKLTTIRLGDQDYPVLLSNVVAAGIFLTMGVIILTLTATGRLAMPGGNTGVTQIIQQTALKVSQLTDRLPLVNLVFVILVGLFLMKLLKKL